MLFKNKVIYFIGGQIQRRRPKWPQIVLKVLLVILLEKKKLQKKWCRQNRELKKSTTTKAISVFIYKQNTSPAIQNNNNDRWALTHITKKQKYIHISTLGDSHACLHIIKLNNHLNAIKNNNI